MAAPRADKTRELADLRDRLLVILRFMSDVSPSPLLEHAQNVVHSAFERRDLRGLRTCAKDLTEWTAGLSSSAQDRLDAILEERFGARDTASQATGLAEVTRILTRGAVTTAEEYRLLAERAEQLYADDTKRTELERINQLLASSRVRDAES